MADENRWGTVFMGPTTDRESRLDKISNREEQDLWNRRTEAEYLRRVKERAVEQLNAMLADTQEQAAGLLAAAQADAESIRQAAEVLREEARQDRETAAAELENARDIRAQAYDEGYDRGVEQAMLELEEQRGGIDATTLAVLKAIEEQCGTLFASWRGELTALLRQSVETATGWVLTEERAAILEHLLCSAVTALEDQRRITVRANPVDVPAVEEVLNSVRTRFHELKSWDVKSDETLVPGGLVVESASGRVESLVETRREVVEQALRHLTLPESAAEAAAAEEIHAVGERSGVPALEQAVFAAEQKALEQEAKEQEAQAQAEEAARFQEIAQLKEFVEDEQPPASDADPDSDAVQDDPEAESGAGHELLEPAEESDSPDSPRPPRPTPKNPALVALPEGTGGVEGVASEADAELDRQAKEIARAMMFDAAANSAGATQAAHDDPAQNTENVEGVEVADVVEDGEDDLDLDTPLSDAELLADMPDIATMTPEEAEAYTRKLMEVQD